MMIWKELLRKPLKILCGEQMLQQLLIMKGLIKNNDGDSGTSFIEIDSSGVYARKADRLHDRPSENTKRNGS